METSIATVRDGSMLPKGQWTPYGYEDERQAYAPGYEPSSAFDARGETRVPDELADAVGVAAYRQPDGGVIYRTRVAGQPIVFSRGTAILGGALLLLLLVRR